MAKKWKPENKWSRAWGSDRRKRQSQSGKGRNAPGVDAGSSELGGAAGKGDARRPGNEEAYRENYEKIFGSEEPNINVMSDEDREELEREMAELKETIGEK